jgi:hypothetical protein
MVTLLGLCPAADRQARITEIRSRLDDADRRLGTLLDAVRVSKLTSEPLNLVSVIQDLEAVRRLL